MKYQPENDYLGNFTTNDATIDFYLRIRSLLNPQSVVLDYGAGRASWFQDDQNKTRKKIRHLLPDIKDLIAVDEDPAVLTHPASSSQVLTINGVANLPDQLADIIISDFVLEHIENPENFVSEVGRLLKPGGWLCARTPHRFSYPAIISKLISNVKHQAVLKQIQPGRKPADIFPAYYRLNTIQGINKYFHGWHNQSKIVKVDPAYFFGNKTIYNVINGVHHVTPRFFCGNIFVFIKKPFKP